MRVLQPKELQKVAISLATSWSLVAWRNVFYTPVDITTEVAGMGAPQDTVWHPLSEREIVQAANKLSVLFANEAQIRSFMLMLRQLASDPDDEGDDGVLVKTKRGLRLLNEHGKLVQPTGNFIRNYIQTDLNDDPQDKAEVFSVVSNWLRSDEEAESLLHHTATILAPHWSAVKYVLLLGEGRNGKSLYLSMLKTLFGDGNVSNVTRQAMSSQSSVCVTLNGKLANIVMDGPMSYLGDNSTEKTLIAGEPISIRLLYDSLPTEVQTNALFLEGLNREPKTRDKSPALQKRLSRFQFPNVYPQDRTFEKHMRSPKMLGALLSLLVDRYVTEDKIASALAPTQGNIALQMEQQVYNTPVLGFMAWLLERRPEVIPDLRAGGVELEPLREEFSSWLAQNHERSYKPADMIAEFRSVFELHRKTKRVDDKYQKVWIIDGVKPELSPLLDTYEVGKNED